MSDPTTRDEPLDFDYPVRMDKYAGTERAPLAPWSEIVRVFESAPEDDEPTPAEDIADLEESRAELNLR